MTPRFVLLQVTGVALFVAAFWLGWPQMLYAGDQTYLTALIAGLGICGLIAFAFDKRSVTEYLIRALPRYGLFGTVVGLAIVAANSGGDFQAILGGLATAFYTTMAGLLSAEWLRLTRHLS